MIEGIRVAMLRHVLPAVVSGVILLVSGCSGLRLPCGGVQQERPAISCIAAPLLVKPFTRGEIGVLMRKGQDDLLAFVNDVLARMSADGTLAALKNKYGLR